MEDLFYSSGKIGVVIGVIAIIFLGLIVFLIRMERRLDQLEKRMSEQNGRGDR